MAALNWPEGLPVTLRVNGLSVQPSSNVIRTAMDAGPKKARRRYTANSVKYSGSMILGAAQMETFKRFYRDALADGALRFNFTDPISLEAAEFRFTADYSCAASDGFFEVTLPLEKMS
jgi:hypothetical protein